jgi:hypothetical protein
MLTIGIDPGISGAIAVIDHNNLPRVYDMPVRAKKGAGKVRNEIDPKGLQRVLRELVPADETALVVMEQMHAFMGGEKRVGSMASQASLAATKAVIVAICEINDLDVMFVTPREWQSLYGIKTTQTEDTKKQSLRIARQLYGMDWLPLAKHDGRADALLIARYGQRHFA